VTASSQGPHIPSGKPEPLSAKELLLLLPNVAKLFWRLARDHRVPLRTRALLLATGAYLAMPFDIIPDWIPVLGYLDDVALVVITLRSVARRVPSAVLDEHWSGATPLTDMLARLPSRQRRGDRDRPAEETEQE
jgi:uncharacterized membrane protein YkvA (DUF1232 family)